MIEVSKGAEWQGCIADYMGQLLLIGCFLFLNSTLNLSNKWALGIFPYPVLLTSCHMASTVLVLGLILLQKANRERYLKTLLREWKGIGAIGATLAINISLNNTSMLNMTLSLNQVVRSAMPIFTCMLAFPVEGKVPKPLELLSLTILSLGIIICVWKNDTGGSVKAMTLCLLATISNSAMSCFSGKVMSEAVDALQLIFLTAPVSLAFLLPHLIFKEVPKLMTAIRLEAVDTSSRFRPGLATILVATSIVAIVYNYTHVRVIHSISATTTTVIGQVKTVGLVLLSAGVLGESSIFDLKMIVGSCLAFAGFAAYSLLRLTVIQSQVQKQIPSPSLDEESASDVKEKLLNK